MAPIAGLVEDVSVEAGESIGTLGPVIRLVQNDPLRIDVPVPDGAGRRIGSGTGCLGVLSRNLPAVASPNGRIINISAVADAASDTRAGSHRSAQPSEASGRRTRCRQHFHPKNKIKPLGS